MGLLTNQGEGLRESEAAIAIKVTTAKPKVLRPTLGKQANATRENPEIVA